MLSEVSPFNALWHLFAFSKPRQSKLVIINVHSMLLDCRLLFDGNLDPRIQSSTKTKSRRVVFKPWLKPFLYRCFEFFSIAFWGSKSHPYIDDVVLTMLGGLKGVKATPLFTWFN